MYLRILSLEKRGEMSLLVPIVLWSQIGYPNSPWCQTQSALQTHMIQ